MKIPILTKKPFDELIEKYGNMMDVPEDEIIFAESNPSLPKINTVVSKGKGMSALYDRMFEHFEKAGYVVLYFNDNTKNQNIKS